MHGRLCIALSLNKTILSTLLCRSLYDFQCIHETQARSCSGLALCFLCTSLWNLCDLDSSSSLVGALDESVPNQRFRIRVIRSSQPEGMRWSRPRTAAVMLDPLRVSPTQEALLWIINFIVHQGMPPVRYHVNRSSGSATAATMSELSFRGLNLMHMNRVYTRDDLHVHEDDFRIW